MEELKPCPWENGYYKLSSMSVVIFKVSGEKVQVENIDGIMDDAMNECTWMFGKFGAAHAEVAKQTGKKYSNVEVRLFGGFFESKGVLSDDGKKITLISMTNEVDSFIKMSEEEYTALAA